MTSCKKPDFKLDKIDKFVANCRQLSCNKRIKFTTYNKSVAFLAVPTEASIELAISKQLGRETRLSDVYTLRKH